MLRDFLESEVRRLFFCWVCPLIPSAPVGSDLYVQGHLDIEQVLILSQVLSHLPLQVPQLRVQVADGVLSQRKQERESHLTQLSDSLITTTGRL